MSQLKLKNLDLSLEDVRQMLKRSSYTESEPHKIEVKTLGDVPAGIMSTHFIIYVRFDDVNENQSIWSCFVKRTPKDHFGSKYAEDLETFHKEGNIYQKLIPVMQKIGEGHKPWTAICYLTKGIELIALENLNVNGFVQSKYGRIMDLEHLTVVMHTLARMHAASLALEEKEGKLLPKIFPNLLRENGYPSHDPPGYRQRGVCSMIRTVQHFVRMMSDVGVLQYDNYTVEEIVKMIPSIMHELFELVKPSTTYRNVFNQSDLWANNILFKYQNEKVTDCRIIDFQFARYAPPTFDIATAILTGTTRSFKEEHVSYLLDIYYESLKTELDLYEIPVDKHLKRADLEKSFQIYNKASLVENLCFFQLIYLPESVWADLIDSPQTFEDFVLNNHTEICSKLYESNDGYRNKIQEMIQELLDIHLGVIGY